MSFFGSGRISPSPASIEYLPRLSRRAWHTPLSNSRRGIHLPRRALEPDRSAAHELCDEVGSSIIDQNALSACGLDLRDGLRPPDEINDPISTFFSEGESDPFTSGIAAKVLNEGKKVPIFE
jgi:hypothetical protein